jgi:hypothetical protein
MPRVDPLETAMTHAVSRLRTARLARSA